MPAEVWLWLLYHNHCGIKITGSTYTRFVAAGMWSNFVVDYLLVDAGMGGSGNYHADSSHVGWPDIFRTMLHTHHALMGEQVDLGRERRAAADPRPQRRALRRRRRHAPLRLRRPARRARHAQGADRRRRRPARGEHRQGRRLRLHAVRQLPPRLPARGHHHQAGAHGPERPRAHGAALPQLGRAQLGQAGGAHRCAQPRERGARGRRERRRAARAARRYPQAARPHRPAGDAGVGRRRGGGGRCGSRRRLCGGRRVRGRRRRRRRDGRRAAAARTRFLPRRLAGRERAGHRGRHLGSGAAELQRRQQPRRRHRLRRLRAAAPSASGPA